MKFSAILPLLMGVVSVSAQLTAPTRNYNVTSPVSNGPYVIGQILPCTYRLFSDVDSSALVMQITLEPTILPSNDTLLISSSADVTKTDAFIKRDGNLTYYEHSINFNIPSTIKPGNYKVVFFDVSTNTQLPIPIEVRPPAVSTSSLAKATATSTPGQTLSGGSIFNKSAASSNGLDLTVRSLMALLIVALATLLL
ncbi:hypothetical protein BDF14DRAFT_1867042 [Spinellus fusiger]|nr:hypothetical protein BDF14DRAFT_1867042 [Spinellus fusiger]